jgi:hypothetical protein
MPRCGGFQVMGKRCGHHKGTAAVHNIQATTIQLFHEYLINIFGYVVTGWNNRFALTVRTLNPKWHIDHLYHPDLRRHDCSANSAPYTYWLCGGLRRFRYHSSECHGVYSKSEKHAKTVFMSEWRFRQFFTWMAITESPLAKCTAPFIQNNTFCIFTQSFLFSFSI